MDAVNLDVVTHHFKVEEEDIMPYALCQGVSIEAFNKYIRW